MLSFRNISKNDLDQILIWRMLPEVTRYMITDIEDSVENQKNWFKKVKKDNHQKYWIIVYEGEDIGVINLSNIDYGNRCSWGYYIGDRYKRSLGFLIPPYLYNYVFQEMELNKIIAEVIDGNKNVIKMHEMHGYRFVGTYIKHIEKNNKYFDIHVYELFSDKWLSIGRYKNSITSFE